MRVDQNKLSEATRRAVSPPDFSLFFENFPTPVLIVEADEDFTIVSMNQTYRARSGQSIEATRGRSVFAVFPDDPADPTASGVATLRASLTRVVQSKSQDLLPVHKYSIPKEGGGFELAYWSAVNAPLLNAAGDVTHIIHKVEDVTGFVLKQGAAETLTQEESEAARLAEREIFLKAHQIQETHSTLVKSQETLVLQLFERNQELEAAYEQAQMALDAGHFGTWEVDPATDSMTRNLRYAQCFGLSDVDAAWTQEDFYAAVHADDRDRIKAIVQGSVENKTSWSFETRVVWADQSVHWISNVGNAYYDESGKPIRFAGIVSDITRRKSEEMALAKSERDIRGVLNACQEGIWGVDKDGFITFVNEAAIKMFRYGSADEMVGQHSHALVHHTHADGSAYPASQCAMYEALNAGVIGKLQDELLWRKDGSSFRADYQLTPLFENGTIIGTVASFLDNTERRELTGALKQSQGWLSATLNSIGDAVIATSADALPRVVFMNAVAEALTGWTLEDARGLPVLEVFNIVNQQTRRPAESPIDRVLKEHRVVGLANHTVLIARNGAEFVIEDSAAPIVNATGVISGVVLVFRDTTEKAKASERERQLHLQVDAARQELYQLIMQTPLPIAILMGKDLKFTLANSSYEKLAGRQVSGKNLMEAFSQEEAGQYAPLLTKVLETAIPFHGKEVPTYLPDESGEIQSLYLNVFYHPFLDNQGACVGVIAVVTDVTDEVIARKIVENANATKEIERENFRNLFRQTPEMMCILSGPEHRFEIVNSAHVQALGFDATGMTVREAQPESVEVHSILDEVYRTGNTAELREIPVTLGSKLRYFNLTYAARRNFDGKVDGIMVLGSEITAVVETRSAILEAKQTADAANDSKTAFMAHMSHEIRTPIGVIMGFAELLQDPNLVESDRQEYLQRVVRNTKGLTRIIDDILDLAKVEAGKLEVEHIAFSLSELLHEVIDLFSDRAKDKGLALQLHWATPSARVVRTDPTRLRQILINIIGNAIKFTTSGSVNVHVQAHSPSSDKGGRSFYEIRVIDTGIGLSRAQMEKLFKPFVQADGSTSRRFGGTGLGLVISRRLASALGGSIEIEDSVEGKGCTFVISFFDESSQDQQLAASKSPASEAKVELRSARLEGLRLLVAEDSIDNQLLLRRILTHHGATVTVANNGEEAIRAALTLTFDLILMDVQMPHVNGHEAARALRQAGFRKPIIALTAHAMVEERQKTKEAGCDAHLTKPINFLELIDTVEAFTKGSMSIL